MFNEYDDMVTIEELCYMLRICRNKAYELLRSGKIKAFKEGKLWMIPKPAVIDYISRRGQ